MVSILLPEIWPSRGHLLLGLISLAQFGAAQTTDDGTSSIATTSLTSSNSVTGVSTSPSSSTPTTLVTRTTSSSSTSPSNTFSNQPSVNTCPAGVDNLNGDCRQPYSNTFGYYYVFIAVFFFFVAGAAWFVHQRRRKRMMQSMSNRRSALARDVQNDQFDQLYANTRRWTGSGRHGRETGGAAVTRADEGLDPQGEAPPPYKPAGEPHNAGLAVPMLALHRDGSTSKPPDYHEHSSPPGDLGRNQGPSGPSYR